MRCVPPSLRLGPRQAVVISPPRPPRPPASAHIWWAFILVTVLLTMVVEPYCLAFAEYPGLYPPTSPDTVITVLLMTVYAADIVLNFFV